MGIGRSRPGRASSGLGSITPKRADNLKKQSRQLRDAYLPGAAVALTRLAGLADQGDREEGEYDAFDIKEPGDDLPDEQRHKLMARHLTKLWAMVRRGQKYLDEKLEEEAAVVVITEDRDSVVAARHHVMERAGVLDSGLPRHGSPRLPRRGPDAEATVQIGR